MPEFIALADCEDRRVYEIDSRNLTVGVFRQDTGGFIGIREKFRSLYLFEEFHWERSAHLGTVRPRKLLDVTLPDEIQLSEHLSGPNGERLVCAICGRWAEQYRGNHYELSGPPFYRHVDEPDGYDVCKSEDDRYGVAHLLVNQALFDFLKPLTDWVSTFEDDVAAKRRALQDVSDEG